MHNWHRYQRFFIYFRENKYRQYVASGGQKPSNETTEAIPVNYVGGYLAFYRTGHKVISATNIIMNDADKIDSILPEQLKMGDFVVVRETARDLIREMADVILARSGKDGLREMAGKWKEALEIETLFYSDEEIYRNLQKAGCTKGYQAVRGWIHDDDVIAPQSKQDLEHIAAATGSSVLKELLDEVYDAAQTVRSAHVQAGRVWMDYSAFVEVGTDGWTVASKTNSHALASKQIAHTFFPGYIHTAIIHCAVRGQSVL